MKNLFSMVLAGTFVAGTAGADPVPLADTALDAIAAGTSASAITAAVGNGAANLTAAHSGASVVQNEGPKPGIGSSAGASGGSASGFAVGAGAGLTTGVSTQATASGQWTRNTDISWSLSSQHVQISAGFSHAVGHNGAWIFGGP